jgi:dephospho-CoA kinase
MSTLLSDKENEIVDLIRNKRYEQAHEELSKFIDNKPLPPVKLAIIGKLRSGKSAIATYLWMKHDIWPVAFADPLKQIYTTLFGNHERKDRAMLQQLGEKLCEIDPNIFVNVALKTASSHDRVCVSDVRKHAEYDALKDAGYTFIRVTASEETRLARANAEHDEFSIDDLRHHTETDLDDAYADYVIINDGTIDDLYEKVDELIAEICAE